MIRIGSLVVGLSILVSAALSISSVAYASEHELVSVSIQTDKVFYSENAILKITPVLNNSGPSIRDIRAVVSIASLDDQAADLMGEEHFSQTYFVGNTIEAGQQEVAIPLISLSRWLPGVGSYVLTVDITSGGETITGSRTAVMVRPRSVDNTPLNLVLVWDIHRQATFDSEGSYQSDNADTFFESVVTNLLAPAARSEMPSGYSVSPLALMQAAESGQGNSSYPNIPESADAQGTLPVSSDVFLSEIATDDNGPVFLKILRGMLSTGDSEYIQSPLAHASLGDLAEYGWHSDVFQQIDRGRQISDVILGRGISRSESGRGYHLPEGELSASVIADLAVKDVGFAIAGDDSYDGSEEIAPRPYMVRDTESNEIPVVFSDSRIERLLEEAIDTADASIVMGALLNRYLESAGDTSNPAPIVVLAPKFSLVAPRGAAINLFYQLLASEEWIQPLLPSDLLHSVGEDTPAYIVKPRGGEDTFTVEDEFTPEMISARVLLKSFLDSAEDSQAVADQMWPLIYLAQDTSWRGSDLGNLGMSLVRTVTSTVENQFERVTMNARPVTLTSETGKIPVEIRNDSDYSLTLQLVASGSGIHFPDGDSRVINLSPGAEVESIPVEVRSFTREPVTLTLLAGEHVIGVKELAVSGNSTLVVLLIVGLGATILGAVFAMVVIYRRRGVGQRIEREKS